MTRFEEPTFTVGEVQLFAGRSTPREWLPCAGQMLKVADERMLFAVLGNRYGGDGNTTFQLPNLTPLKSADPSQGPIRFFICARGEFPMRG